MSPRSVPIAASAVCALLLLANCGDASKTTAAAVETKPVAVVSAAPITGKTAYWEMYKMARTWATDITPLSLTSKKVAGHSVDAGKHVTWTAAFASPSKKEMRSFSYSVVAAEGVVKGAEADRAMAWGGPARDAMPFRMAEVGVDSDAAYQTAVKKAEAWIKAHPKDEVSVTLGSASRFPAPVWYILWGDKKAGFNVWVNATTGATLAGN